MDGFRVETKALQKSSEGYFTNSTNVLRISDCLCELRQLLLAQTIDIVIINSLDDIISQVNEITEELRYFGNQCRQIAEVYEDTERSVSRLVANLPTVSAFLNYNVKPFISLLNQNKPTISQSKPMINTHYTIGQVLLISGSRLQCEDWLLQLAIAKQINNKGAEES
ncbi:MAG: hypothetical protein FWG64_06445 [Firmicutes bacterium]|nr:hypothetical protein [Bacillota bacterium]